MELKISKIILSIFILLICIGLGLILGDSLINPFALDGGSEVIFYQLRLPRVVTCSIVGALLSVCGLYFQTIFRNDLATPYTLGVASGASLGAMLAIYLGLNIAFLSFNSISLFALIGGLVTIFVLVSVNSIFRQISTNSLILCGVALSMFFSSVVLLLQFLNLQVDGIQMIRWMMGSVDVVGYDALFALSIMSIPAFLISLYFIKDLNLLSVGDEFAHVHGVNVKRTQTYIFILTSLIVAPIVAEFGPIGFVGMIVPHVSKIIIGRNHLQVIPVSVILGASFLVVCDLLSRIILAEGNLPLGVVTSFIGGPFFLWILYKGSTRN